MPAQTTQAASVSTNTKQSNACLALPSCLKCPCQRRLRPLLPRTKRTNLEQASAGLQGAAALTDALQWLRAAAHHLQLTVVVAVADPQPGMLDAVDDVVLMGSGSVLYHGPAAEALPVVQCFGYSCPAEQVRLRCSCCPAGLDPGAPVAVPTLACSTLRRAEASQTILLSALLFRANLAPCTHARSRWCRVAAAQAPASPLSHPSQRHAPSHSRWPAAGSHHLPDLPAAQPGAGLSGPHGNLQWRASAAITRQQRIGVTRLPRARAAASQGRRKRSAVLITWQQQLSHLIAPLKVRLSCLVRLPRGIVADGMQLCWQHAGRRRL